MTIFRSSRITLGDVSYTFVSANDPDTIGVEVLCEGNVILEVSMDQSGNVSVLLDQDGGNSEFDLGDLRSILAKCEADLQIWRSKLIEPEALWSEE